MYEILKLLKSIKLFFLSGLLCLVLPLNAKVPAAFLDTSETTFRLPDTAAIAAYKGQRDFTYTEVSTRPGLLERFSDWLLQRLAQLFGNENAGKAGNILLIIFGVLLVGGIIYLIFKIDRNTSLRYRQVLTGKSLDFEGSDEDLQDSLDKAAASGKYNEAVRLALIHILRLLNRRGIIRQKSSKSNRDYITELSDKSSLQPFLKLNHYFEYAYYGDFTLNRTEYEQAYAAYEELRKEGTLQ